MEKLNSSKHTKLTKKKPIKVVYISNPMKVKAKAADFRALVQQLTGRDSDLSDSTPGLHHSDVNPSWVTNPKEYQNYPHKEQQQPSDESTKESGSVSRSDCSFDGFDDVYMPQLLDNLPAILSSNWWNESTHVE